VNAITGGFPPYSFAWSNGKTGQNINNLKSGLYFVTVTDSIGCNLTDTVFVGPIMGTQLFVLRNSVKIFPNPFTTELYFNSGEIFPENSTLKLRDVIGRIVFEFEFKAGITENRVDVGVIPSGVYVAEFRFSGFQFTTKLFRQ